MMWIWGSMAFLFTSAREEALWREESWRLELLADAIEPLMFQWVLTLFPSARGLDVTWSSVVKIGQSLYRKAPGKDPFRPDQMTHVHNFFGAGSYVKQLVVLT